MRISLIFLCSLQVASFFVDHPATNSFQKSEVIFSARKISFRTLDSLPHEMVRNDFKEFYDEYDVAGIFVLFDSRKKEYTFYHKTLFKQPATPASTCNILLTLIGLQEGIIKDENSTIFPVKTSGDSGFNKNLTLKAAFAGNYESFFRQMVKQIGPKRIKYWLDKIDYGNKNTSEHENDFWLGGSLKITPEEQLDFIMRFYHEDLPFSKQYFQVVKKIMLDKDSSGCQVYGKRGSYKIVSQNTYIGWFVGYLETPNDTYFFVNFIQSPNVNHPRLVDAQKGIPYKIFRFLSIDG
ncbi:MAG TPA: penicillin-binding transpeptidase domain-containing protein [Puia sp.]|nr:penicillin-binding transpeptidase domain-containing protein [Puia sp.]